VSRIVLFCDIERPMRFRWASAVNRLVSNTLMRAAAERPFHITAFDHDNRVPMQKMVDLEACEQSNSLVRFVAGTEKPEVMLVCGYLRRPTARRSSCSRG
jgi:aspartyl/asparaginyl beta-hydroxylase (cupin superfamily)